MASKAEIFKRVAFENITRKIETYEQFEDAIGHWWRRKYKIPDTDKRFLAKRPDDMVIEYFEDQFRESPQLLTAYSAGYNSIQEMEEKRIREIMGEDYTDEVAFFSKPTEIEKKEVQAAPDDSENEAETILEF